MGFYDYHVENIAEYNVRDYGAVGDGVTDDTVAFETALALCASSGGAVIVPAGTYVIAQATGISFGGDNISIVGVGNASIIEFSALAATESGLNALNRSNLTVANLQIDISSAGANRFAINYDGCNNSVIRNIVVTGSGRSAVYLANTADDYNHNVGNIVDNCIADTSELSGYGFAFFKASETIVSNCSSDGYGDGFKFLDLCVRMRVIGNYAKNAVRDGFDFYDGFVESTAMGNVSEGNTLHGFDIKGTSDGTDYVVRSSTFSGNVARNNGQYGYSITSIRDITISNNQAVGNTLAGYYVNTVQFCTFVGNIASENTQEGFSLHDSNRNTFTSNQSLANSYDDGTVQNGTYHGWCFDNSSNNILTGNISSNTLTAGKLGGQGYGFYWTSGTSNILIGNYTFGNVTGDFSGVADAYINQHIIHHKFDGATIIGPKASGTDRVSFNNNIELGWYDSGGTRRVIMELTNADDLYIGGSHSGSVIFVGGGAYTERFRIADDGTVTTAYRTAYTPDAITATSDGVAASVETTSTEVTTNGDSDLDNVTLANGVDGQIKHIYCVAEGNAADTWKITPASMIGGTQITFSGVGEGCTLVYDAGATGWIVIGNNGGTIS